MLFSFVLPLPTSLQRWAKMKCKAYLVILDECFSLLSTTTTTFFFQTQYYSLASFTPINGIQRLTWRILLQSGTFLACGPKQPTRSPFSSLIEALLMAIGTWMGIVVMHSRMLTLQERQFMSSITWRCVPGATLLFNSHHSKSIYHILL